MNLYERDNAGSACLEIDGRKYEKEGNKERGSLGSLREENLEDKTKMFIGNKENVLDLVAGIIAPCKSNREEEKIRREHMDCIESYIARKHFVTHQTSDINMLSVFKKSSNLMTRVKRLMRIILWITMMMHLIQLHLYLN